MPSAKNPEFYAAFFKRMQEHKDETLDEYYLKAQQASNNLIEIGWMVSYKLGVHHIYDIASISDAEVLEEYMCEVFTSSNDQMLKYDIDNFLDSTALKQFKKIIQESFFCFENAKYIPCVLSLISLFEGMASQLLKNKQEIRIKQPIRNIALNDKNEVMDRCMWVSCSKFVDTLYEKSYFNQIEPLLLNRHWLLHGRSLYKVTIADCLNLYNSIFGLHTLLEKNLLYK